MASDRLASEGPLLLAFDTSAAHCAAALVSGERVELLWRQSLWETIGGGTSEVMRGVVARQALGLGGRA